MVKECNSYIKKLIKENESPPRNRYISTESQEENEEDDYIPERKSKVKALEKGFKYGQRKQVLSKTIDGVKT